MSTTPKPTIARTPGWIVRTPDGEARGFWTHDDARNYVRFLHARRRVESTRTQHLEAVALLKRLVHRDLSLAKEVPELFAASSAKQEPNNKPSRESGASERDERGGR